MFKFLIRVKKLLKYASLSAATTATILTFTLVNYSSQSLLAQTSAIQTIISGTSQSPSTTGTVVLTETAEGLRITGTIANLTPGEHGFHVHEYGSCGNDADDAGGHFNPAGVPHGHLLSSGFENAHGGDLGNIYAAEDGIAKFDQVYPGLTLADSSYSVMGRSLVVHANPDDFATQPTGNSGARIGCGVIGGG
ncbi:putative superoxide dismutase [Stanieria sp. NIES-3757]|nr:putative superoxide dismutase [Stanieria sp. NIES-3757]